MLDTVIFDFDETLVDAGITHPLRKQSPKDWDAIYSLIPQCKPYDGMHELFDNLKGYKIGIATMCQREMVQRTVDHMGLDVDVIVGSQRYMRKKPHPQSIFKVLDKLSSTSSTTIGIGDKPTDIQAYKSAGLAVIVGCTWGITEKEKEELISSAPHYIIDSPMELIEIIKNH